MNLNHFSIEPLIPNHDESQLSTVEYSIVSKAAKRSSGSKVVDLPHDKDRCISILKEKEPSQFSDQFFIC